MATETFTTTTTAVAKVGERVVFPYPSGQPTGDYQSSGAVLKVGGTPLSITFAVSFGDSGAVLSVGAGGEIPAGVLTLAVPYAPQPLWDLLGESTPLLGKPLIAFMGTSITEAGRAANNTNAAAYHAWAMAFSGYVCRYTFEGNLGVSGNTTTQMVARYGTLEALNPSLVVLDVGTNDLGGGTPSTTIGNIAYMIGRNRAIGAKTIIFKIMPRGSVASPMTAQQIADWEAINEWIGQQSAPDVQVIDTEPVLGAKDANHTILSTVTYDDLHPNVVGARLIGRELAKAIRAFVQASDDFPTANVDPTNLLTNGFMTGTSGTLTSATGSVATGWAGHGHQAGGATVVFSKVARADGFGSWQQMVVSGTYTGNARYAQAYLGLNSVPGFTTGDLVEGFCEVEVDKGLVGVIQVGLIVQGSMLLTALSPLGQLAFPDGPWTGKLKTLPFVLPSAQATLVVAGRVLFKDTATTDAVAAKVRFGRFGFRKVA